MTHRSPGVCAPNRFSAQWHRWVSFLGTTPACGNFYRERHPGRALRRAGTGLPVGLHIPDITKDGEVFVVKVIGIDPGLAMTGFGVVETLSRGGRACEWGTIRTEAASPLPLRLKTIYDELKRLLEEWTRGLLT